MLDALGYIAGSLLAPSLAGYLLSRKLTNKEEKKLVKEIEKSACRKHQSDYSIDNIY